MALGPGHLEGYYGAAKYVDKIFVAPTHETCRLPGRPSSRSPSAADQLMFQCFVADKKNGDGTMSGYYYHATMNWDTGSYTYGMGES